MTSCDFNNPPDTDIFIDYSGSWDGVLFYDELGKPETKLQAQIIHNENFFNAVVKFDSQEGTLEDYKVDGIYVDMLIRMPQDSLTYLFKSSYRNRTMTGSWFIRDRLDHGEEDLGVRIGGWRLTRPIR